MRPHTHLVLAAAVIPFSLSCAFEPVAPHPAHEPPADVDAVSAADTGGLSAQDSVRLLVQIHGCFLHVRYELTLYPDSAGARVAFKTLEANLMPPARLVASNRLDREALRGLDALFAFYENLPTDYQCSGVTLVERTQYRQGAPVQAKTLVDNTCAEGTQPGVVPLWHIVQLTPT